MRLLAATKGSPPAMVIRRATGSLVPMCQMKPTRRLTHWQTVNPLPKPTQPRRSKRPWPSGRYVRLQAEFDNYRKRTLKEKMDLVQTGGRDVLLEMLPVRDDVQRAVDAMQKSDDLEALRAGVTLISQKFTEALRRKGVTEIEVLDKEFDADFSEAVARFAAGDEKKGKVIDVVQTGYMLGEKVLRFAKVVVGE